jgi:hypothetical protein
MHDNLRNIPLPNQTYTQEQDKNLYDQICECSHYVPKYWLAADLDHWFGLEVSFFRDAGAKSSS